MDNAKYYLTEKLFFFENVALLKKLILRSSVDMFVLNNSAVKMAAVPKINCPEELPILKKWLLGRIFALKK